MTIELFIALTLFSVPAFFTPGPNNIMLMTSGLNYGVARTMPHMFGVDIGFGLMVGVMGLGLRPVFEAFPVIYSVLKVLGTGYLLYLAWKIAIAGSIQGAGGNGRPFSFAQAAAFQWVNPKAWGIAISIITAYVPQENFTTNVVIVAIYMAAIGMPASFTWVLFGSKTALAFEHAPLSALVQYCHGVGAGGVALSGAWEGPSLFACADMRGQRHFCACKARALKGSPRSNNVKNNRETIL